MADEFMRAVAVIAADDTELRTDLKQSERQVKESTTRMQGDFDKLKIGAQTTGVAMGDMSASTANAAGSVTVLGSAAALTGSSILNTAAQAGTLGVAFSALGDSVKSATQQMRALAVASAKFLLTPVGILLAIAAAFAFVGFKIYGVFRATGDYEKAMESAAAVADKLWEKQLRATAKGADAAEKAFAKLRAELAGPTTAAMHAYDLQIMEIHKRQLLLQSRLGQVGPETEAAGNLRRELKALASQRELLAEQLSRNLQAIEDERRAKELRAEEEQATKLKAIYDKARAYREQVSAAAVTAWEKSAFGKISAMVEADKAQRTEREEVKALLPTLNLTAAMLAKVQAAFGLTPETAGPRGGGISANAYAFGFAAGGGGGVSTQARGEALAKKSADGIGQVAENTRRMETHLEKMATGAL